MTQAVSSRAWTLLDKVQKHPEVAALSARVEGLEAEARQVDKLISLPREERFEADRRLYAECHGDALPSVKNQAMLVAVAGLAAGCAAAVAVTMVPGLPQQLSGLIALATLVVTFVPKVATKVSPMALYAAAAKKWILPPKIDKAMLAELSGRKQRVDGLLAQARQAKESLSQRVLAELEKEAPPVPSVGLEVEEEQVVVNGISIPRRRG